MEDDLGLCHMTEVSRKDGRWPWSLSHDKWAGKMEDHLGLCHMTEVSRKDGRSPGSWSHCKAEHKTRVDSWPWSWSHYRNGAREGGGSKMYVLGRTFVQGNLIRINWVIETIRVDSSWQEFVWSKLTMQRMRFWTTVICSQLFFPERNP